MTTWTTISNSAVAVGGIPSSTTVTALRDNPVAIAEAATGAPIDVVGWHPVDKVTVGDGKTGIIYDGAINGTVPDVTTPLFEDGWEYKLVAINLLPSVTSNFYVYVQWEGETIWDNIAASGTAGESTKSSVELEFNTPRLVKNNHGGFLFLTRGSSLFDGTRYQAYNATAKKLARAKVDFPTAGSVTAGKVYLFRRRDYASLP